MRVVVGLLCALWAGFTAPTVVSAAQILVLPFVTDQDNEELRTFRDFVEKTIKASLSANNIHQVVAQSKISEITDKLGPVRGEASAIQIGSASDSDLLIYGVLSADASGYYIKCSLYDLRSDKMNVTTEHKVSNIHQLPGIVELFLGAVQKRLQGSPKLPLYRAEGNTATALTGAARPTVLVDVSKKSGPWRSPEIASSLAGVEIGPLLGISKNETLFLEDAGITISRFEDGGLKQLTQYAQFNATHLSLETADIDGDGIDEIILCYQTQAGIESCILKYVQQNLQVVDRIPNVLLRTIPEPAKGSRTILVGQRTDVADMFTGAMIRYAVESGKVTENGTLYLPPGTLITSYDSGVIGSSEKPLRAILNQDRRLMIFDEENRLLVGGGDKERGTDRKVRIPYKNTYREFILPGRLQITDLKGEGRNDLLVIKNSSGAGAIEALTWDGSQLTEKWKTIRSAGVITDFKIGDFKNQGTKSLVLILQKPHFLVFTNTHSIIYAYDLAP